MELAVVGMALLRRWYVTLAGLLATSGLVYLAYTALPPTYSASGSVLLLPASASVESGANPLLQLGGLEQPTSLVIAYLAGNDAREEFAVEHPDVTYDIVLDPLARGPVILITVEGPTAGQTVAGLNAALDTVPDALATLQDRVDAPASAQIRSRPLTVDPAAETVWTSTLRALIGAAGVGGAATLGAAVIVDSFSRRRKDRRAALAAADSRDAREVTEFASRGAEDPHAGPAEPSWDPQAAGWPAVTRAACAGGSTCRNSARNPVWSCTASRSDVTRRPLMPWGTGLRTGRP
ncbi:MAG TPA: hypothetical protein PKB06_04335 [Actinotalea sp.]|nr:hypothetical protein [Actinotalea sp.]